MFDGPHRESLQRSGFQCIGVVDYRLQVEVWWSEEHRLQVLLLQVTPRAVLIKASKAYYLTAMDKDAQTWVRDVGPLHHYLEGHFPEMRIAFSHFRDVNQTVAREHLLRRGGQKETEGGPRVEQLRILQGRLNRLKDQQRTWNRVGLLRRETADLMDTYMGARSRDLNMEITAVEEEVSQQRQEISALENLQQQYLSKGSAACFLFSVSSNVHSTVWPSPDSVDTDLRVSDSGAVGRRVQPRVEAIARRPVGHSFVADPGGRQGSAEEQPERRPGDRTRRVAGSLVTLFSWSVRSEKPQASLGGQSPPATGQAEGLA